MDKNLNLRVGTRIGDWVVCGSSNDSMVLFPLVDQANGDWDTANAFCSNFNTSPLDGWTVTSSRMPSMSDWKNIMSQTGISVQFLTNGSFDWLSDRDEFHPNNFYYVSPDGNFNHIFNCYSILGFNFGVRPLITITLVK